MILILVNISSVCLLCSISSLKMENFCNGRTLMSTDWGQGVTDAQCLWGVTWPDLWFSLTCLYWREWLCWLLSGNAWGTQTWCSEPRSDRLWFSRTSCTSNPIVPDCCTVPGPSQTQAWIDWSGRCGWCLSWDQLQQGSAIDGFQNWSINDRLILWKPINDRLTID